MQCKKDSVVSGFEDEREGGHEPKDGSKSKKMSPPVKPSDRRTARMTLSTLPSETPFRLLTHRAEIVNCVILRQ